VLHTLAVSVGFGLITASVIALGAVGATLQFGVTNYVNFAYGAYMTLSGYLTWIWNVHFGLNIWVSMFVSAPLIAGLAVVVNRLLLRPFTRRRLPVIYLLIVTLGLWLIIDNTVLVIFGPDARQFAVSSESPLRIGPFIETPSQLIILGVGICALVALHLLLTRTRLGKAMRAMSDDAALAQVRGIDTERVTDATWLATGFLVGLAGAVLAVNLVSFDPFFGDNYLFLLFAAVILGGIGQPYGTMLGALIIGLATEVSAAVVSSAYKSDIAFLVLIVVLLVRPQGIIPARGRH
jgi:branched-subunit amino acid ABC-type transport system permease component